MEMAITSHLEELVGRTITGVVVMQGPAHAHPRSKINLVLDDGTYLELFGNDIHNAKGCWPGGLKAARNTEGMYQITAEYYSAKS